MPTGSRVWTARALRPLCHAIALAGQREVDRADGGVGQHGAGAGAGEVALPGHHDGGVAITDEIADRLRYAEVTSETEVSPQPPQRSTMEPIKPMENTTPW